MRLGDLTGDNTISEPIRRLTFVRIGFVRRAPLRRLALNEFAAAQGRRRTEPLIFFRVVLPVFNTGSPRSTSS